MTSGYTWDGLGDEGGQHNTNHEPEPTPRDLRKQLEAVLGKLKERDEQIASLQTSIRAGQVKEAFTEAGLPPKAVKLFPKDQDPTPENVKAFVEEFGDLFGKPAGGATGAPSAGQQAPGTQTQTTTSAPQGSELDAQTAAFADSLRRLGSGETGVTPSDSDAVSQQTLMTANANATDLASFIALLRSGAQPAPIRE